MSIINSLLDSIIKGKSNPFKSNEFDKIHSLLAVKGLEPQKQFQVQPPFSYGPTKKLSTSGPRGLDDKPMKLSPGIEQPQSKYHVPNKKRK